MQKTKNPYSAYEMKNAKEMRFLDKLVDFSLSPPLYFSFWIDASAFNSASTFLASSTCFSLSHLLSTLAFGSTRARSTQLRRFSHLPLVSLYDGDLMTSTRVENITSGISMLPVFSSFLTWNE